MGHRSRSEIVSQILQAANGGSSTDTKIMYMACLNYDQLKEYLTILIESDLAMTKKCIHLRPQKKVIRFFKPTIR
jgi:predicted transcriptional regulator